MKKIKNVGKVLTNDQQKAIKGGDSCGNFPGPCAVAGQFAGYCVGNGNGGCVCTMSGKPC